MDDTPQQNDWEVGNDCFYEDMKRTLAHQRQPRVFPMMNIDIWVGRMKQRILTNNQAIIVVILILDMRTKSPTLIKMIGE